MLPWVQSQDWVVRRSASVGSCIVAAVQYLRVSSAGVSTGCLMILAEGADSEKRFDANRYTQTSKQSRTVPTRGRRMSLCCCNIMVLSVRKDGTGRTRVQGIMPVVFLSALSRSNSFPGSGSRFL